MKVATGLDVLSQSPQLIAQFKGNVALLCHNASVNQALEPSALVFRRIFGKRLVKLFGPQHGFSTDAQDNMIESDHFIHPYLNIPVYSLYSETRVPTDAMLEGIDHLFVDLQDVGCRMYTYSYTLTLILEKCAGAKIEVIVLDRPNPVNGVDIEGNVLDMDFASFVGRHPMPVRHGLTLAEIALMHQRFWVNSRANLRVIAMEGWERNMYFGETGLPWLLPSPNLSRAESTLTFPGLVLFEATNLSEGRGTTQPLEIVGHPEIDSYALYEKHLSWALQSSGLQGVAIRPIVFLPTFDKHAGVPCGGFQLHVTDRSTFKPWRTGQFLLRELCQLLGDAFQWRNPPFEYEELLMPIDILNGSAELRKWVQKAGTLEELNQLEQLDEYLDKKRSIEIYP